jgi:hypothetical protein
MGIHGTSEMLGWFSRPDWRRIQEGLGERESNWTQMNWAQILTAAKFDSAYLSKWGESRDLVEYSEGIGEVRWGFGGV